MQHASKMPEIPLVEKLKGIPALFGIRFGEEPRYEVFVSEQEFGIRGYGPLTLVLVHEC